MNKGRKGKIYFHYLIKPFSFRDRRVLKKYILRLVEKEGKKVNVINYIFCSDEYLLNINKKYLNHNTYTDIVTFELSSKQEPIISDVYISIERVRENAKEFKTRFSEELCRVIFHGALHLVGYKDKSLRQSKLMRTMEEACLNDYKVSRNTVST